MKSALNLDLTLSNARSRQADAARIFFMVVGAFCVELRPFYCNERISVPMSYISPSDNEIAVYGLHGGGPGGGLGFGPGGGEVDLERYTVGTRPP